MSIFGQYQTRFEDTQEEEYSLEEYLTLKRVSVLL